MRSYTSPKVKIKDAEAVLRFLAMPSNFKSLMPDSVQSFEASDSDFKFQLAGMPAIHLKKINSEAGVIYENQGGSISFGLNFPVQNNAMTFEVKGNINAMVHLMLSKPLTNLLAAFSQKLLQQGF
jgi:hypothetical protein